MKMENSDCQGLEMAEQRGVDMTTEFQHKVDVCGDELGLYLEWFGGSMNHFDTHDKMA